MKYSTVLVSSLILAASTNALGAAASKTEKVVDNKANKELELRIENLEKLAKDNTKVTLAPAPKFVQGGNMFQIYGTLMTDMAFYNDDRRVNQPDGILLRTARLGVKGEVNRDWFYKLETSFSGNALSVTSGYVGYQGIDGWKFSAGQIDEPFSMEEQMSSRWTTFLERGSLNVFVPGISTGLLAETSGKQWSFATGVFGNGAGTAITDDAPWSITARATCAPYLHNGKVIHLGLSGSYEEPSSYPISYTEKAETRISLNPLATGTISNVQSVSYGGAEFAVAGYGASLQSEYIINHVDRKAGLSNNFSGEYVQATYTLTGENREYDAATGTFGKVSPKNPFDIREGGIGAWEVAARYNVIDLKHRDVNGGSMHDVSLALNWYPIDAVKIAANYGFINVNAGTSTVKNNANVFMLRGQVAF